MAENSVPQLTNAELYAHIDRAGLLMGQMASAAFSSWWSGNAPRILTDTESPIEAVFYVWFYAGLAARRGHGSIGFHWGLLTQQEVVVDGQAFRLDFQVVPTKHIMTGMTFWEESQQRFGIALVAPGPIAIELDGHDFHERTKEQVAVRNRRDRLLQLAGWTVFHFSGSELYRNPMKCVDEVFALIESAQEKAFDLFLAHRYPGQ